MSLLRRILTIRGGGGLKVTGTGSGYYDMEDKIWMQEQGGYYNFHSGTGALYIDSPPSQQGGYFNRV